MQIEQLSAEPRPRLSWEAADLGLALLRRHYGAVMAAWCAILLPLAGMAFLVVWWTGIHPAWLLPVFWWLKPALDRPVLWYLSRALFGAAPPWHQVLRHWPGLVVRSGAELLWRRFSSQRSLLLPVRMLEGVRGGALRQRLEVLRRYGGGEATWLGIAAGAAAGFVSLGLMMLAWMLVPEMYQPDWELIMIEFEENFRLPLGPAAYGWLVVLYLVVVTLVEPFYVAAGFGMYLNSRAWLEGWDIELGFRRLSRRLQPQQPDRAGPAPAAGRPGTVVLLAGLGLGLGLAGLPSGAMAAEEPATATAEPPPAEVADWDHEDGYRNPVFDDDGTRRIMAEVLADPEFEVHTRRVPVDRERTHRGGGQPWLAMSGRWLFWITLTVLAAWLAWWLWQHRDQLRPRMAPQVKDSGRRPGLRRLAGIELDREALPTDVPGSAWQLWQDGQQREALALLYRAALTWLGEYGQLPLRESDTEQQCLDHSRRLADGARREAFAELSRGWVLQAYGNLSPAAEDVRRWCRDWPFHLGGGAGRAAAGGAATRSGAAAPAATALLLAAAVLTLTSCQREFEEIEVGYRGEARKEPLLAAQRMLEHMDWHVIRQGGLLPVAEYWDDLMVVPGSTITDTAAADALEEWISWGGHVLLFLEGAEIYTSDWQLTISDWLRTEAGDDQAGQFLQRFGIEMPGHSLAAGDTTFDLLGRQRTLELGPGPALTAARAPDPRAEEFMVGDPQGSPMISLRHNDGRITVVNNARPFRNRWIADHDHGLVWMDLMALSPTAFVVFVSGGGELSFVGMLWREGWRALVPLMLLVLLWWWRCLPRFGPRRRLDTGEGARIGFDRHLHATGGFFHRQGRLDALLEGMRRAVWQVWWRHSHPAAETQGGDSGLQPDEAVLAKLADRAGVSIERVRSALIPDDDARQAEARFVLRVADLQLILRRLAPGDPSIPADAAEATPRPLPVSKSS